MIALVSVNFVKLDELTAATSGGFLVVYATVNVANFKLARETGSHTWLPILAGVLCIVALGVTLFDFMQNPATMSSAIAILAIVLLAIASEQAFRSFWPDRDEKGASSEGSVKGALLKKAKAVSSSGHAIAVARKSSSRTRAWRLKYRSSHFQRGDQRLGHSCGSRHSARSVCALRPPRWMEAGAASRAIKSSARSRQRFASVAAPSASSLECRTISTFRSISSCDQPRE